MKCRKPLWPNNNRKNCKEQEINHLNNIILMLMQLKILKVSPKRIYQQCLWLGTKMSQDKITKVNKVIIYTKTTQQTTLKT